MSDQQDKNIEQLAQETAAAGDDLEANVSPDDTAKPGSADVATAAAEPPATAVSAAPSTRRGSSALAWIALLLVLVVAGGLGWSVWDQQHRDALVAARLQAIEATSGREAPNLDDLNRRWQEQLKTAVGQMQAKTAELRNQTDRVAQKLEAVQAQVVEQNIELGGQLAKLSRYSSNDREDWLLAEAQYLLRMANQRLVMAGDVVAAQALLDSVDKILVGLDDVRLHDVRAALAADLASVRAVPRVDVQGAYLRLAALVEQADGLLIFQLPQQANKLEPAPAQDQDWRGRLRQGWEAALAKLSNYIIIRRRDVPMQALLDPQWEGMVRQNLRMLLEQAQLALLSGNQVLYRNSLERAQHWVGEFFATDEATARAMSREITQLTDQDIASELPDISRSVQALDAFMEQRLQYGGAQ